MKNLFTIVLISLLMFSCDNSTEPELESYDCNDYIDEICGSCSVNLWDDCYDIEGTTELDLSLNDLTGEIPSEIGNLYNLTFITLKYNQLSGEIPQQVCNLIENNNLYLPGITDGNSLINTCED